MKIQLTVNFEADNAAFNGDDNFQWEMRMIANRITKLLDIPSLYDARSTESVLHDSNGNRIGTIKLICTSKKG